MQMKHLLWSATTLILLTAVSAIAADAAIGRITYIYPNGQHLILDGEREYSSASVRTHAVHEISQETPKRNQGKSA